MRPPRAGEWLLRRILACASADALLGDLAEDYALRCHDSGRLRATLWYWKQVFASIPSSHRQRNEAKNLVDARRSPSERTNLVDTFAQDLRHAMRSLYAAPGFTFAAVTTLIVGLGITAVMFTVVWSVLARPLPYDDPDQLLIVGRGDQQEIDYWGPVSYPAYETWRDNQRSFDQFAAYNRYTSVTFRLGDDPERHPAARVSANYFSTLRVAPMLGRDFHPDDDGERAGNFIMLSHDLWASRFAADPDAVGSTVRMNQSDGTIIGVMPPDFVDINSRARAWVSMANETRRANTNSLYMVGRLTEGVTRDMAAEDLDRIRADMAEAEEGGSTYESLRVRQLHEWIVGDVASFLKIAGGAVVLVMLIMVANLSNLTLVHTANRGKELAVRAAIGAGRGQIVRLLLVEAAVLGIAGAVPALLLSSWSVSALVSLAPTRVPRAAEVGVDGTVLAFIIGAGLVATIAASLVAVASAQSKGLAHVLRAGGSSSGSAASGRTQRTLAVAQLALALALMLGVGLLMKSLVSMQAVDTGFVAADALIIEVSSPAGVEPGAERRAFYTELEEKIAAIPGVEHVGVASFMPFTGWSTTSMRIEGMPVPDDPDELPSLEIDSAGPGFFSAMGTRVIAGRDFAVSDVEGAPRVAIVNEALAQRYWPDQSPIGRSLFDQEEEGEVELTIVGVVQNVRARGVTQEVAPKLYTAYAQSDYWWPYTVSMVMRSSTPPSTNIQPIRAALRDMVAQPPLAEFSTLEDWLAEEFADLRFQTSLFGVFAVVALLLAGVGLYGVIASGVAQRTREIGVRMALGADTGNVLRQVIGSGIRLAAVGTLVGAPLALLVTRSMDSMLFGVSSIDPATLIATIVTLNTVCIAACWLPARRASRVAPVEAMRR